MKIKSVLIALALVISGAFVAPAATASEKPVVESFTFSPQEVDLLGADTKVTFELVVSHPNGIDNTSTLLSLKNSRNDTLATYLTRTDSNPATTKVTFKGVLTVPRDINPGVYTFSAGGVKNNSSAGYQYETGTIEGGKVRALVGAETALLVRSGGDLNFDYTTFVGPAYDTTLGVSYNDPIKFSSANTPIWKVGESYDPAKYYELRVPTLALGVTTSTADVCSTDGKTLKFLKEGTCSFIVSTPKTKDYVAKTSSQSATITAARIKPTLTIDKIANQDVKDLGKSIEIGRVYSVSEGYVMPATVTPSVCLASGFYVKLLAGGTCKLTYQTAATSTYQASDLYTVTFEILKDGKPVVAPTPAPTPTKPQAYKKTISCVKKGKTTKKVTGVNPKCPKGYTIKKK